MDAKSHLVLARVTNLRSTPCNQEGSRLALLVIALGLIAVESVADAGAIGTLPPVGRAKPEHAGYLVVYSATKPVDDGDVIVLHAHRLPPLQLGAVFS